MEVEIDVPRTFEITLDQIDAYLMNNGWSGKQDHNELTCKYQCLNYPNVYVILPKTEGSCIDETRMLFGALRLIANVNNNCGIEAIINRVVGVGEVETNTKRIIELVSCNQCGARDWKVLDIDEASQRGDGCLYCNDGLFEVALKIKASDALIP